jgi:hypothetical protein
VTGTFGKGRADRRARAPAPRRAPAVRLAAALCAAGFLLSGPAAALQGGLQIDCTQAETQWSETEPPVNLTHVFCGEIDRRGEAVGFHARPGGADPPTARLIALEDGPNALGVYTGIVAVLGHEGSRQDEKFSSFFPDAMTPDEVLAAILTAYRESGDTQGKWRGDPAAAVAGARFEIEGWLLPDAHPYAGRINTAWPIYVEGAR